MRWRSIWNCRQAKDFTTLETLRYIATSHFVVSPCLVIVIYDSARDSARPTGRHFERAIHKSRQSLRTTAAKFTTFPHHNSPGANYCENNGFFSRSAITTRNVSPSSSPPSRFHPMWHHCRHGLSLRRKYAGFATVGGTGWHRVSYFMEDEFTLRNTYKFGLESLRRSVFSNNIIQRQTAL